MEHSVYGYHPNHPETSLSTSPTLAALVRMHEAQYSLHPQLVNALDTQVQSLPHLSIVWPTDVQSAAEKFALLELARDDIAREIGGTTRNSDVVFWVAKTISVSTKEGKNGLITDIVSGNDRLSDTQKRFAVAALIRPELINTQIHELADFAKTVSRRQINSLQFSQGDFDLPSLGLAPGVVGPWALSEIPRIIFPLFLDESHSRPSVFPLIDFAVSTRVSILLPNINQAFQLPRMMSEAMGISHPLYIPS